MNGCTGSTSACSGEDPRPVTVGLRRHEIRIFCAGCRAVSLSMGLRIVERRAASVPVARDRRTFVAPWRRSLPARDLTGAVLR